MNKTLSKVVIGLSIIGSTLAGWFVGNEQWITFPVGFGSTNMVKTIHASLSDESVMVVGGSMARGWMDPNNDSYVRRAFTSLSTTTNTTYDYIDKTIIGGSGSKLAISTYKMWLNSIHPQIVVLTWGLLNDADQQTSLQQFRVSLQDEVSMAVQHHAVVFIVTPPVTRASSTGYEEQTDEYVGKEWEVAKSFRNPNVYLFDVLNQMRAYLQAHHQTYQTYSGNGWHPNQAGHLLAGELLYNDMIEACGQGAIHYASVMKSHARFIT